MRRARAAGYRRWEHQPVRVPRAELGDRRSPVLNWGSVARFDARHAAIPRDRCARRAPVPCGDQPGAHAARGAGTLAVQRHAASERAGRLANRRVAPFDNPGETSGQHDQGRLPPRRASVAGDCDRRAQPHHRSRATSTPTVNDLRARNDRPDAPVVGVGSWGRASRREATARTRAPSDRQVRAENPFCKWHNARRGYAVHHRHRPVPRRPARCLHHAGRGADGVVMGQRQAGRAKRR